MDSADAEHGWQQSYKPGGLSPLLRHRFAISVTQVATGSATISWTPPTQNTDGSSLTNLAGYRLYYGTNSASLTQTVQIANAGASSFVVDNLSPATWYFAVKAYQHQRGGKRFFRPGQQDHQLGRFGSLEHHSVLAGEACHVSTDCRGRVTDWRLRGRGRPAIE